MKKIYLFASVLLAGLSMKAQLTQSNHAYTAGDNYQMYQCDSTNINPGAGGAGANWNFAAIATHSSMLATYTVAASTNTNFPNASVSVTSSTADVMYYSSSSSSQLYHGGNIAVAPVAASLMYTAAAVSAVYPMALNTSSSSAIGGSINATSPVAASGTFVGTSFAIADGTGTLMLPGTTYSNVTRVLTTQTINFNALVTGTLTQMTYEYFQPGVKGPLLSIKLATVVTGFSAPSTQTLVTRMKAGAVVNPTTSIGSQEASASFFVYPNPSVSHVNFVAGSKDAGQVMIYDVTGKLVEKRSMTEGKLKLDVSSYNKGLYIYTVVAEDGKTLKSGKLTIGE